MAQGLLMVYTGSKEGTTFVSLGQVVRALGRGLKVLIMKCGASGCEYGELLTLRESHNALTFLDLTSEFPRDSGSGEQGVAYAVKALESVKNAIESRSYDLLVLCGFADLTQPGLLDQSQVIDVLAHRPLELHVLITGTCAPEALIAAADLVTDIRETTSKG